MSTWLKKKFPACEQVSDSYSTEVKVEPVNEHNISQLGLLDDVLQKVSPHEREILFLKGSGKLAVTLLKYSIFTWGSSWNSSRVSLWQSSYNEHSRTGNVFLTSVTLVTFHIREVCKKICNRLLLGLFSITPVTTLWDLRSQGLFNVSQIGNWHAGFFYFVSCLLF